MSRCPRCGAEHGMAWGTGDCGCEPDFDIGMNLSDVTPEEIEASRRRTERNHERLMKAPIRRAVIVIEGPDIDGLTSALTMLELKGFPESSEGRFEDKILRVKGVWRIE